MIATETRPRALPLLRRLAATVGVGALIGGMLLGAAATPTVPTAVDDEESTPATASMQVAVGTTGQIAADGSFDATVQIQNPSPDDLGSGVVTIEIGSEPLTTSTDIDTWLGLGIANADFSVVATTPSDDVLSGETAVVEATASTTAIDDLAPGVYPVRASISTTSAIGDPPPPALAPAGTVVIVPGGMLPRTAVLMPLTATPQNGSLLTADELAALTAEDGALTAQLDAVTGSSAILGVDPAIIAAIRLLGTSAPESATAWLSRLENLSNDQFLLQFGDADAAVQAQAGEQALLQPGSFQPLLDAANFTAPTPTATPDDSAPAAGEAVLPDDTELTALPQARTDVLWPRAELDEDDLSTFADYLGDDVTTILPASATDAAATAPAPAQVGGHSILLTSDTASARLSAAVTQADEVARNRELAATIAHLSLSNTEGPVLLGLARSEARSGPSLRTALSALSSSTITLDELTTDDAPSVTLTSDRVAERATALAALLGDEQRLASFATILDEPRVLLTPERIRMLRLIGVGVPAEDFPAAVRAHREDTTALLDAVGIQEPSAIQLFTAAAPLPVWIRNDLPWPVRVSLTTEPSDARLDVQPTTEVDALADSNTRVTVPVEARVASGSLRVDFRLSSPAGVPIGQPQSADVTVRADWEGIGLGILGGIIVLLLAFGVIRTVRRRRRDAAADVPADTDAADSGEAVAPAQE